MLDNLNNRDLTALNEVVIESKVYEVDKIKYQHTYLPHKSFLVTHFKPHRQSKITYYVIPLLEYNSVGRYYPVLSI